MRISKGLVFAACLWAASLSAQPFRELATNGDGSLLYVSTGSKILLFDGQVSRPFAAQDGATLGWMTASADGRVVAYNALQSDGTFQANLASAAGSVFWTTLGQVSVSRNGRYALFISADGSASLTDLVGGTGQVLGAGAPFPVFSNGSTVAADGTTALQGPQGIAIIRTAPDLATQQFTAASPTMAAIDDGATTLAYDVPGQVFTLDLGSGNQMPVAAGQAPALTSDGTRVLYLSPDNQVWIAARDGSSARKLTSDSNGIAQAAISGDGSVVYAITLGTRVLRIDAATGAARDITDNILGTAAPAIVPLPIPTPAPPPAGAVAITSFSNNPVFSTSGSAVTLSWTTQNAVAVGMTGPGLPPGTLAVNGSLVVNPTTNTVYTLLAYGADGSAVSSALYVFVR